MTFRQVFFVILEVYLAVLLWRVAPLDTETAKELADTIPCAMVVLLMVPLSRFKSGDVMTALRTWKGVPEGKSHAE